MSEELVREAQERYEQAKTGPMAQAKMILVAGFVPALCDALEEALEARKAVDVAALTLLYVLDDGWGTESELVVEARRGLALALSARAKPGEERE